MKMSNIAVNATDGPIGTVESMLRNSRGVLTHIVVQDPQPWGSEEILVPIEKVELIQTDRIQLTLNKRGLSLLPTFWSV
jgi:hypothetical protein